METIIKTYVKNVYPIVKRRVLSGKYFKKTVVLNPINSNDDFIIISSEVNKEIVYQIIKDDIYLTFNHKNDKLNLFIQRYLGL